MALTIEDGTGNASADSYGSVAEYRTFATNRGVSVDSDDVVAERELRVAFDHMNVWERAFVGYRTTRDQRGAWPRVSAYIDGWYVDSNAVPQLVKECQFELAMDHASGIDLNNREFHQATSRVKAGDVEVQYSSSSGSDTREKASQASVILQRLFKPGGIPITPSFAGEFGGSRFGI